MQKLVRVISEKKIMQSLKLYPVLLYSLLNRMSSNSARSFISRFSTVSLPTVASKESISVIDYLISKFKFPASQLVYFSKHVSGDKPLSVMNYFKQIGFSEAQIYSMLRQKPQILFSDIDKTLRPKIEFFQRMGLEGSDLCKFISKNSTILTCSLNKTLVPSVEAIRKMVCNEKDLIRVLHRSGRIIPKHKKFLGNVAFLESCGVVGSHLSVLLKRQSWLFVASESLLRNLVSRAVDMGFHEDSGMFVHALHTISGLSNRTFRRKLELIQCFGFSKDESLQMFRRAPTLLRTSEKKLKFGIEFFLHTVMIPKSVLVHRPMILMYSMEDRVVPRYRVLQLIISKKLCKKGPNFIHALGLSEEMFLEKYISQFTENTEALLVAYKGHYLEVASK